jgi:hypothetical protein
MIRAILRSKSTLRQRAALNLAAPRASRGCDQDRPIKARVSNVVEQLSRSLRPKRRDLPGPDLRQALPKRVEWIVSKKLLFNSGQSPR